MKPLICIDFDDVLTETARALTKAAHQLFGTCVPYHAINNFFLEYSFNLTRRELDQLMKVAHEPSFLLALEATPGAIEGLRVLQERADIEIVTGRPPSSHEPSLQWLHANNLDFPLLHIDKYGRFPPGTNGSLTLEEYDSRPYRFAVDDSPISVDRLTRHKDCRVYILDRPWNATYKSSRATRVHDWTELINQILPQL